MIRVPNGQFAAEWTDTARKMINSQRNEVVNGHGISRRSTKSKIGRRMAFVPSPREP